MCSALAARRLIAALDPGIQQGETIAVVYNYLLVPDELTLGDCDLG